MVVSGISFWLYQNWEILGWESTKNKPKITKEQQKLNREQRNPYFNDKNY
jgi:hypothetical protein